MLATTRQLRSEWFPSGRRREPCRDFSATRQLNRLFHEVADAAGIKKGVTLHALRHSFATICLSAAPIFASSKRFWVTTSSTPRRATPASPPA